MHQKYRWNRKSGALLWMAAVLLTVNISAQTGPSWDCPSPCQTPNPDFDPDNSYETDDACIPCCENQYCTDNWLGCGCCEDGSCEAPTEDCPNPPMLELSMFKVGGCGECEKAILGCAGPSPVSPTINNDTCFKACEWKPGSAVITVYYYEGLCPEKCQTDINSADDVDINNYCDVLEKLKAEIKEAEEWLDDPPIASEVGDWDGTVDPFCFGGCISQHEATHIQQLHDMLMQEGNQLLQSLSTISVPFDCDEAKTAAGAANILQDDIDQLLSDQYDDFLVQWGDDDLAKTHEIEAHQISLQCMQDLLAEIEAKIAANGWKAC